MKAYTNISQSKKLAEILPLSSADMRYHTISQYNQYPCDEIVYTIDFGKPLGIDIPCWSLAALQDIIKINYKLEKTFLDQSDYCTYSLYDSDKPTFRTFEYNNPVDACYEMVIKLHEQKLL